MANQIYCKHCGKLIDADYSFCIHCGGEINSDNKTTPQANKPDVSFIRQLDILGGKFIIGIINIIKWCGRTIVNFGKFIKRHWKRILIFILGIAGAILLIYRGCEEVEEYRAMFIMPAIILIILTLYFSCSKSIKLLLPSSILLLCSYGIFIYDDHQWMYGANTTFFDTVKREFYWITPNYTIPDSVTSIGNGAFYRCYGLKSVTIGNSVTSIGDSAFGGCTALTSVTIGNSVTSIGSYAFSSCTALTSVDISDLSAWCKIDFCGYYANPLCHGTELYINGVVQTDITIPSDITEIKAAAFEGCTSLTSVTIPDSVTWIRDGAFGDCTSLTSVYCKATTPPKGDSGMFAGYNYGRKIYVPRNSVEAYKMAEGWKNYADYIVGYDF